MNIIEKLIDLEDWENAAVAGFVAFAGQAIRESRLPREQALATAEKCYRDYLHREVARLRAEGRGPMADGMEGSFSRVIERAMQQLRTEVAG